MPSAAAAPSGSAGIILDSDQIPSGVSKGFVRLPGEDLADFHARVTHLHHQRQNIRQIGDLVNLRRFCYLNLFWKSFRSVSVIRITKFRNKIFNRFPSHKVLTFLQI